MQDLKYFAKEMHSTHSARAFKKGFTLNVDIAFVCLQENSTEAGKKKVYSLGSKFQQNS